VHISDHVDRLPEFLRDCGERVRLDHLRYREDIVDGLERAPDAFIGLLRRPEPR
jgi:NADPH-dependent curcumin reductase CurA